MVLFVPGFMCVGAPLGCDVYMAYKMRKKLAEQGVEGEATSELLAEEKQAM